MADSDLWAVLCVVAVAVAVVLTVVCDWEWGQGGMKAELAVGAWWSTAIEESWVTVNVVVTSMFHRVPGGPSRVHRAVLRAPACAVVQKCVRKSSHAPRPRAAKGAGGKGAKSGGR